MFDGGGMSSIAFILYGFASIPLLLTIKPKNFLAETPKTHLAEFNFIFSFLGSRTPQLDALCEARISLILLAYRLYTPP